MDEASWGKKMKSLPKDYRWKCNYATRQCKKGRAMGGIITGVRKEFEELESKEDIPNCMQLRSVKIAEEEWRVLTVYDNKGDAAFWKGISYDRNQALNCNLIVGGDFNARTGNLGSKDMDWCLRKKRDSRDKIINKAGRSLVEEIEERGWYILNGNAKGDEAGEWTYIGERGSSVIDYVLVNEGALNKIDRLEVEVRTDSDHLPLAVSLEKGWKRPKEARASKEIETWNAKSAEEYRNRVKELRLQTSNSTSDDMKVLIKGVKESIPKKRVFVEETEARDPQWWDKECKGKKREMYKAIGDWRKEEISKEQLNQKRREYKSKCEEKKEEASIALQEELKTIKSINQAWGFMNRYRRRKRNNIRAEKPLEEWRRHYMELLQGSDEKPMAQEGKEEADESSDGTQRREMTRENIERQIRRLKKKKAPGSDGVRNEAWMFAEDTEVWENLVRICLEVWQGKGFPEEWRKGTIMPLFKKGDSEELKNYRGITLLNTSYKIYAMALDEMLKDEMEEKALLPETQAGFRKNRSTIDNIYILNHVANREIKKSGGELFAFFVDFRAAFDTVDRELLWRTLKKQKISNQLIERLKEIYEETVNKVRVGEKETTEFWTSKGLRQGCPLSPSLFTLLIADVEDTLRKGQAGGVVVGRKKIWTLAFADDLALLARNRAEMKEIIMRFERYVDRKKLEVNVQKSKIMVFKKGRRKKKKEDLFWKGEIIEEVEEFKYLGFTFKRNGRHDKHVAEVFQKALISMKTAWSIGEKLFGGDFKMRTCIFDSLVGNMLSYAVEIWGFEEKRKLEGLQEKYLRWCLGVEWAVPGYIVLEETKRKKLRVQNGRRAMRYEMKIRRGDNDLLKECLREIEQKKNQPSEWEEKRIRYCERNGYSAERVGAESQEEGNGIVEELARRDEDVQRQEQFNRIQASRYNAKYRQRMAVGLPHYLSQRSSKRTLTSWARQRCEGVRFWEE